VKLVTKLRMVELYLHGVMFNFTFIFYVVKTDGLRVLAFLPGILTSKAAGSRFGFAM
jgi:hypothetical protein